MIEKKHGEKFIEYLQSIKDDKGALAALKRGVAYSPGEFPPQYVYIVPWIPPNDYELPYFLTASLFGTHPENTQDGNFGDAFRKLKQVKGSESIDLRFNAILQCRDEDLSYQLRNAVSLLASENIPVNYYELFYSLRHWGSTEKFVQKKWARGYWRFEKVNNDEKTNNNE
ncbi:MAG: type I-E CRISPR-associated protein Cse2/CasB [Ignavibacteriales bacterium]|nr:type I-E CRISPR-associated protein Cse2/CasB [Ignavibacteriales bacterium]MCF8315324.1 type I-E CRISPR-associated protein Cse2/CasB [Ignavibacteriales bacterium]MCF8436784.1 type I-E CRISPR-associated protein Cse2/CasB [Ignavibacteriales bacterium]